MGTHPRDPHRDAMLSNDIVVAPKRRLPFVSMYVFEFVRAVCGSCSCVVRVLARGLPISCLDKEISQNHGSY